MKVRGSMAIRAVLAMVLWLLPGGLAVAQELSALAKLVPAQSRIEDRADGVTIDLAITQPVPWRVRVMDDPPRLVLDTREVDWTGLSSIALESGAIEAARAGVFRQGWSRLVLALNGPYLVEMAEMSTDQNLPRVRLTLRPASQEAFSAAAALPEPPQWALPAVSDLPKPVGRGTGPIVVVLDPGHGGIDPGAERDGHKEADLMLTFAREMKEVLLRDGRFLVVLTRDDDVFVPLETRISIARAAGAHVFLSLHADALAEGEAVGATLYTLDDEATDEAAQALAERHDRDDLLSGVDLTAQDDLVATILIDMARTETEPRVLRLAAALEGAIKGAGLKMHRRPHQTGGFSVLKSPDIPSALLELGFLSSARDMARLTDADWRAKMAAALRDGLGSWADEDASLAALRKP
ncbi:MAG: N-acetylmuramoyl-L-alanine amidase [Rhodobacteraceae bacterium]|nr:N-acetylmuramoyl-L-alanine amidase [Paracoccaceae bacterium]MCF8515888.1 N-acetylmuramoyl-L-alanine amidase [Paracoccaceae bacterium]MCF8520121.1 N-acetylmuramoyl-L-alanine amidase [Paracoccaceae bacterium]